MNLFGPMLVCFALVLVCACGGGLRRQAGGLPPSADAGGHGPSTTPAKAHLTPLLVRSDGAGVAPVRGSDGAYHLLWEVPLQNATSLSLRVTRIEILAGGGSTLEVLEAPAIARSVEVIGTRKASALIGPGQSAFAFLTLERARREDLPRAMSHRVTVEADRLPAAMTTTGGNVTVDVDAVVPVLGPPLEAGTGYIAADGCCRSTRHIRAPLPLDNEIRFAQRFAIDWEQLDDRSAFVAGDPADPRSYTIYGKRAVAVAAGEVVHVTDGLEDQVPGRLPGTSLALEEVDGNSVVLSIGDGLYALYAHLQKGSVAVKKGDRVTRGQVLGLVGNTGNSSAPHLHFHVMDGPSPLASNGRPYVLDSFTVLRRGVSTAELDRVENTEEPFATVPVKGERERKHELPLDLSVVAFD